MHNYLSGMKRVVILNRFVCYLLQTSLKTKRIHLIVMVRIKHLSGLFNPINLADHDATNLVVLLKVIMNGRMIF
jgi:hypothetical protein